MLGVLILAISSGPSLWAEPKLVLDIHLGVGNGLFHEEVIIAPPEISTSFLAAAQGTLFFSADDGIHGAELWRSDGTPHGTALIKDILPGPEGSLAVYPSSRRRTHVGGVLYFTVDDGIHGEELWKSDGTSEGTLLVKDLWPGPQASRPNDLVAADHRIFFHRL